MFKDSKSSLRLIFTLILSISLSKVYGSDEIKCNPLIFTSTPRAIKSLTASDFYVVGDTGEDRNTVSVLTMENGTPKTSHYQVLQKGIIVSSSSLTDMEDLYLLWTVKLAQPSTCTANNSSPGTGTGNSNWQVLKYSTQSKSVSPVTLSGLVPSSCELMTDIAVVSSNKLYVSGTDLTSNKPVLYLFDQIAAKWTPLSTMIQSSWRLAANNDYIFTLNKDVSAIEAISASQKTASMSISFDTGYPYPEMQAARTLSTVYLVSKHDDNLVIYSANAGTKILSSSVVASSSAASFKDYLMMVALNNVVLVNIVARDSISVNVSNYDFRLQRSFNRLSPMSPAVYKPLAGCVDPTSKNAFAVFSKNTAETDFCYTVISLTDSSDTSSSQSSFQSLSIILIVAAVIVLLLICVIGYMYYRLMRKKPSAAFDLTAHGLAADQLKSPSTDGLRNYMAFYSQKSLHMAEESSVPYILNVNTPVSSQPPTKIKQPNQEMFSENLMRSNPELNAGLPLDLRLGDVQDPASSNPPTKMKVRQANADPPLDQHSSKFKGRNVDNAGQAYNEQQQTAERMRPKGMSSSDIKPPPGLGGAGSSNTFRKGKMDATPGGQPPPSNPNTMRKLRPKLETSPNILTPRSGFEKEGVAEPPSNDKHKSLSPGAHAAIVNQKFSQRPQIQPQLASPQSQDAEAKVNSRSSNKPVEQQSSSNVARPYEVMHQPPPPLSTVSGQAKQHKAPEVINNPLLLRPPEVFEQKKTGNGTESTLMGDAAASTEDSSFRDPALVGPFAPIRNASATRSSEVNKTNSSFTTASDHSDYTTTFTQVQTVISNQRELAIPGFLQYIPDHDYKIRQQMARGGTATIFLAKIESPEMKSRVNGAPLCIAKILHNTNPTKEEISSFSQEISIMWFFRSSKHFTKLLGFTTAPATIIMKHYQRGSLSDLIYNDQQNISWTSHLIFCLLKDIATGIREMHENGFAHCDIKPGNILIDEDDAGVYAVLADFGISRILSSTMLLVEAFEIANVDGVSVSYAAPEVLRKLTSHVSSNALSSVNSDIIRAGDVYSFSMVAYEVINRQQPWSKSRSSTEVIARVLRGERPQLTAEVIGKKSFDKKLAGLCEIMQQCWVDDPMARLQMKWIIEILEQVQNSSVTRI